MLSITYVSSARELLSVPQLVKMLESIRPKNDDLEITGMLLYSGGNIIQTLEGPDDAVASVFASIEADPRHSGIMVLLRDVIEERAFAGWSMGFRNVSDREIHDIEGYAGFVGHPVGQELGSQASPAFRLLLLFRQNMR